MPISKKETQRRWEEKEAQRQNIIKNRDWNALFAMDENDDFSWTLEQIWNSIMSGKNSDIWDKADRVFMDYTDGRFSDLCHIYAQAHRDTVQAG